MKNKIVQFVVASIAFTVALFLVFWLFDLVARRESDLIQELKYALSIGLLSGFFMVFLTNFFKRRDEN